MTKHVKSQNPPPYGEQLYTPEESATIAAAATLLERKFERSDPMCDPTLVGLYLSAKLRERTQEVFVVMFLDTRNRLIRYKEMFFGGIDGAEVHPRGIVVEALRYNAAAVIVAHNHPSGVNEASTMDRAITMKIRDALKLIDVRLLDHFIVGEGPALSFAARGWL